MKRAFAFVLCLLLLGSSVPVHATEISAATTTILENGLRVVDEVTIVSSSALYRKERNQNKDFL